MDVVPEKFSVGAEQELEHYLTVASRAADYLISKVADNGYISASADYTWYHPHWFRDSSWISVALLRYADLAMQRGIEQKASSAFDVASRIINFNLNAIGNFSQNIRSLDEISFEKPDFFSLQHHMPSRVGPFGSLYFGDSIDDNAEKNVKRSWLIQYDSIPLILYSINEKSKLFGLGSSEISFLKEHARDIAEYLGKIYVTECASAWEINQQFLHAYDIASIYAGLEALKEISAKYEINISPKEITAIEGRIFDGGPIAFLKKFFVKDGILYNEKKPFSNAPLPDSIDASEIFIFLNFGISAQSLGNSDIERNTISKMEIELFNDNMLPIRFKGDTYYKGGRWLLLGMAFAEYYIEKGLYNKGVRIVDYVINKYNGSYPEQEIVNPASDIDMNNFYALNGYKSIQNLAWSYAAVIMATVALINSKEKESAAYSSRRA
jgi:hypothetical protein